jgi:hypothetical protein
LFRLDAQANAKIAFRINGDLSREDHVLALQSLTGRQALIQALQPKESLVWFAETQTSLQFGRVATAFIAILVLNDKLPARDIALWVAAVLIGELWQGRAMARMLDAPIETSALKLKYMIVSRFRSLWDLRLDFSDL